MSRHGPFFDPVSEESATEVDIVVADWSSAMSISSAADISAGVVWPAGERQ